MNAKAIAYFIYLILMFANGLLLPSCEVGPTNWKYWAFIGITVGAYLCGIVRGG